MTERISPDLIEELGEDEIFVFGSNLSGRHGKGAARQALTWGAIWGQASGIQGRTYGIPTKDAAIKRTLSIPEIEPFVKDFIDFAKLNPQFKFLVTEIGCGLAGLKPKQVAPMFRGCETMENVYLPKRFFRFLINH